jgi:hypothetical protein
MFKSSKNNMKNRLHTHPPKVTKTTLGPLGINYLGPRQFFGILVFF